MILFEHFEKFDLFRNHPLSTVYGSLRDPGDYEFVALESRYRNPRLPSIISGADWMDQSELLERLEGAALPDRATGHRSHRPRCQGQSLQAGESQARWFTCPTTRGSDSGNKVEG